MKKLVIIHPSYLVAAGLSSVVQSIAGADIEVNLKDPSEGLPSDDSDEASTLYIVSAGVFVYTPGFFLSRRKRCLIVAPGNVAAGIGESGLGIISEESPRGQLSEAVEELLGNSGNDAGESRLSAREVEVLREIAGGKSFKEIADALCISLNTVMSHRKNISSKLGIRSTSGLTLYALMNGLI